MMQQTAAPCLVARDISKTFGATKALDAVNLAVAKGEIHALLGENGAGKSTLVKILSGIVKPDAGVVELEGRPIELSSKVSSRLGIVVVHQELSLLPNLSVAENILIHDVPIGQGWLSRMTRRIDRALLVARAKVSLQAMALDIDPRKPVSALSQAERQLVEIARAQAQAPTVILFDEPTSSLPPDQREALFGRIRRVRESGVGIVFITHFLEEALQISDRITVLRDGRNAGTVDARDTSISHLVELMCGRPAGTVFPKRDNENLGGVAKLSIEHVAAAPRLRDITFNVQRGEIVGLAGLVGSGRTESMKAVFGSLPIDSGTIKIDGRTVRYTAPAEAIEAGIAFVPEDRQEESLFHDHSVMNNICVAAASSGRDEAMRKGRLVLDGRRMMAAAGRFRTALQIKTPSLRTPIASLSGGNQQKVVLARWMAIRPNIILADEPTRGVSIGSKIEIYRLIRQLAADGAAIVIASSEFEELVGLCNRVFMLRDGRTEGEIDVAGLTAEDLLHLVLAKSE
jgi:ABC-type sugar transport system ATPase subunit